MYAPAAARAFRAARKVVSEVIGVRLCDCLFVSIIKVCMTNGEIEEELP